MDGHGTAPQDASARGPQVVRAACKVDMHCHSTASQESKLGVQRAAGMPECATPPHEVYELAKRRGMDFVTITDHDTIAGVLEIADRPDVFISEELTAHFRGEPQAVHVLCYGITCEDHEWLQAHSGDVELCAGYMYEQEIVCALAHPYYTVSAPLTARHRRRLAELFAIWEIRNGARAQELNRPAATYVATREGIGIGGSDDHAGVDIGRTYSETPPAGTPRDFLEHLRRGEVFARGEQGSAAKWAHAAIALAARSFAGERVGEERRERPDPARVMTMVRRLLSEGNARRGTLGSDVTPDDARCLLRAWLSAVGLDDLDILTSTSSGADPEGHGQTREHALIAYMQAGDFSHADLYRRACRLHERKLRAAVDDAALGAATGQIDVLGAAEGLFEACIAAIPYAPATAFLANEQQKLAAIPYSGARAPGQRAGERRRDDGERPRVAILADGIGSTHGVTRTIEEIRQRGVPGFEIDVVGTDPEVDRRLSAVAEIDVPFYPGLRIGVPSLPVAVQTLAGLNGGGYDVIHVCSPGPAGVCGALVARALGLPLVGSYHTELTAYAGLRSGEQRVVEAMALAVGAFYHACDSVLSPSPASDAALAALGMPSERVLRWDRGVDTERFDPALRDPSLLGGAINVLYSGRITAEKGADLLTEAFLLARESEPSLHLVLAGGGPEQERVRERLGEHASFLGWLEGEELARTYASADIFVFPSATDTFGQVILEAQASGVPTIALARGGPLSLIENRVSGLLCEPDAREVANALLELASSPLLRENLALSALRSARTRTWEQTLRRLADGYERALGTRRTALLDTPALPTRASSRAA
jgi:glycosyltransferase involved in cell wall biosynthesis/predicted metal-dependent phosphoesterase TrpH